MAEGIFTKRSMRLWGIVGFLSVRDRITTGAQIAERFGISERSVYRDIDDLRSMGVEISGEAGSGYFVTSRSVASWIDGMLYRNPMAKKVTTSPSLSERRAAAQEARP